MGLTPQEPNDEQAKYSDWARKKTLHDAIIASSQPNKPTGEELWATELNTSAEKDKCNMSIRIARITGVVSAGCQ